MNREEVTKLLKDWQIAMVELRKQMQALADLTWGDYGGPLFKAADTVAVQMTKLVAERIGAEAEWLESWWTKDDFGAKPMRASVGDGPMRTIGSIEELADFLCDINEAS